MSGPSCCYTVPKCQGLNANVSVVKNANTLSRMDNTYLVHIYTLNASATGALASLPGSETL